MNLKELGENLGLDEEEYLDLVQLFVETGSAEFDRLQAAVSSNDMDQVMRSAHTIKGAAGNLGLMDVHEEAKKIEQTIDNGQNDDLAAAVNVLAGRLNAIKEFVEKA